MTWTRRQALRSAAATLWLPLLPSLLPREARAATADETPRRLAIWFLPHGLQHVHVAPESGIGTTTVTEPIQALPGRISVVTGLNNRFGAGSHQLATASLLTDVGPDYQTLRAGISVDQVAAEHLGQQTPFPSLQLAMDAPGLFTSSSGLLTGRVSWSAPDVPLAPTVNPRATYDLLFRGTDDDVSEAEAERRRQLRHSVLDAVKDRIDALNPRLSTADRIRLDQYATGIRELERRIDGLGERQCVPGEEPPLEPAYMEAVSLMGELQFLALSCDLTRVITFMYGPSASDITLPDLGISRGSHQLSHAWAYDAESDAEFQEFNRWHVAQYVAFCRRLAETEAGEGSNLLESTAVVLASEFSDANAHRSDELCMLVAGGEAGGFRPGRHVEARGAPHANLLHSLLKHMQVPRFGFAENATGHLRL